MEDTQQFRNRILKYTAVVSVVFWAVSLPLIGLSGVYAAGLILGTFVTAVNFILLERALVKAVSMEEQFAKKLHIKELYRKDHIIRYRFFSLLEFGQRGRNRLHRRVVHYESGDLHRRL